MSMTFGAMIAATDAHMRKHGGFRVDCHIGVDGRDNKNRLMFQAPGAKAVFVAEQVFSSDQAPEDNVDILFDTDAAKALIAANPEAAHFIDRLTIHMR